MANPRLTPRNHAFLLMDAGVSADNVSIELDPCAKEQP